jgi:hypothetical protein
MFISNKTDMNTLDHAEKNSQEPGIREPGRKASRREQTNCGSLEMEQKQRQSQQELERQCTSWY